MDKLEKFLKDNEHIWPTAGKWWNWVRGGIRRGLWEKHPVKLTFIHKRRKKLPLGIGGQDVWGGYCDDCGNPRRQRDLQVDHINEAGSLNKIEDIQPFIEKMILVTEKDLRWLCKDTCHAYRTHAARYDLSLEEAIRRKKEIAAKKKLSPKPKKKVAKKKERKTWKRR